jgi:biopolymer transport protein ExbD
MGVGSGSSLKSEINVTPLVDVVLVLLIIFMVIIPLTQVGYAVNTPPKVETDVQVPVASDQLILRIDAAGRIFINKEQVPEADFSRRFAEVIKNRESKIVFLAADGEVLYDKVADVIDRANDAGAKNIGIVFGDLKDAAAAAESALGTAPATPTTPPR